MCWDHRGKYTQYYTVTCKECSGLGQVQNAKVTKEKKLTVKYKDEINSYINDLDKNQIIHDLYKHTEENELKIIFYNYGWERFYKYSPLRVEQLSVLKRKVYDIDCRLGMGFLDSDWCGGPVDLICAIKVLLENKIQSSKIRIKYEINHDYSSEIRRELKDISSEMSDIEIEKEEEAQMRRENEKIKREKERLQKKEEEKKRKKEKKIDDYISLIKETIDFKVSGKKINISYKDNASESRLQLAPNSFYDKDIDEINQVEILLTGEDIKSEDNNVKRFWIKYRKNNFSRRYQVKNPSDSNRDAHINQFFIELINDLYLIFYDSDTYKKKKMEDRFYSDDDDDDD